MSTGTSNWFIYSPRKEPWAGLRIATFIHASAEASVMAPEIVVIHNEVLDRMGFRIWNDIEDREGWAKVCKIEPPTEDEIRHALERNKT